MFNFFSKSKQPINFWFSTDIHAHILPGVDDGSADAETSVQLVGDLRDMGINKILASPHIARDTFENTQPELDAALAELREALAAAHLGDVTVDRHSENRIDDLLMENIEAGTLKTLPDKYLLIENSFVQEPWDLEQFIFNLKVRDFKPILAHPERYVYYHDKRGRYEELHRHVMFQVNVLSLAGYYGKQIKKVAETMAERGMIDFLGTDTHGLRHTECFRDYLCTRDARRHRDLLDGKIQNALFD